MSWDYNLSYKNLTPDFIEREGLEKVLKFCQANVQTLIDFYEDYSQNFGFPAGGIAGKKVLDLGCGLGGLSFYFAHKGAEVTGVDISSLAIMGAKELALAQGLEIDFKELDIT